MLKTCTKCNISKPIIGYSPHPRGKSGYKAQCKECSNKYQRDRTIIKRSERKGNGSRETEFFLQKRAYLEAFVYDEEKKLKTCGRCKKVKPFDKFNIRNAKHGPKVQSYCRQCITERGREYRAKKTVLYNKVTMDWYIKLKSEPCTDCGNKYPWYCNDWDHLPCHTKGMEISNLLAKGASKEQVLEEITKCELVCATCHRIRTWARNEARRKQNPLLNEIQERVLLLKVL